MIQKFKCLLEVASACNDVLTSAGCSGVEIFNEGNAERYELLSLMASDIKPSQLESMIAIYESMMRPLHESCSWGWNLEEKKSEFTDSSNRYLLLLTESSEIAAFCIFRFEFDDLEMPEFPVLYCYELHVQSAHMGKKIGTNVGL